MPDVTIEEPLRGVAAFDEDHAMAAWSQAAQLVGLGIQLSDDGDVLDEFGGEDRDELRIPRVQPLGWSLSEALVVDTLQAFGMRTLFDEESSWIGVRDYQETQRRLFESVAYQEDGARAAAALVYLGMYSPWEVVRVAAAAEVSRLVQEPLEQQRMADILLAGCRSDTDTVRHLAADAVARLVPEASILEELTSGPDEPTEGGPAKTSVTVHGTWGRFRSIWWRPHDGCFLYLKTNVSSDLYEFGDYFRWDGGYRDGARGFAADDLVHWARAHRVERFETVFAHSHGGTVALEAALRGLRIRLLVLMSTPARRRPASEWSAIFANIGRVMALRSRFDLVVLADRAPQRFGDRVRQMVPPGLWFTHGAFLLPETWEKFGLPAEIAYERAQTP